MTTGSPKGLPIPQLRPNPRFRDLRVTGLAKRECHVKESPIFRLYFDLSDPPPLGWSFFFTKAWQSANPPGSSPAGIESDKAWIECDPNTLETAYLPQINSAVAEANRCYRAALKYQAAAEASAAQLQREAVEKVQQLEAGFQPPAPVIQRPENRVLRAYFRPLMLCTLAAVWSVALFLFFAWIRIRNESSFAVFLVLLPLWSAVCYWLLKHAVTDFTRRFQARRMTKHQL